MATGGFIAQWSSKFRDILQENPEFSVRDAIDKLNSDLNMIDELLENIKQPNFKIERHESKYKAIFSRISDDLEYANEINKTEKSEELNHLYLALNARYLKILQEYYELKFKITAKMYQSLRDRLSGQTKQLIEKSEDLENKQSSVMDKLENMVSTVLNIIITFSFVSAAVSGIDKIDPVYLPLFLITCMWLPMTFILFVTSVYKKNDNNNNQSLFLYGIVSLLTIIIIFATCLYMVNQDAIRGVSIQNRDIIETNNN